MKVHIINHRCGDLVQLAGRNAERQAYIIG